MFAKVVILCTVLVAACASLIGTSRSSSPAVAAGTYGIGGRGVVAPVDSPPVEYGGAISGRGIGGYGSGAPVVSGPVGYAGRGAVSGRGIGGYGVGAPVAAAPVGYSGQGAIGGRGIGGYGSGVTRNIGAPVGIVRGGRAHFGKIY